jgi:CBS domain-containing protein
MHTLGVGMLPVVLDKGQRQLVGVLTDRDIVTRCIAQGHGGKCRIGDHMTSDVLVTVSPEADELEIATKMERYQVRRLPVIGAMGQVVGVLSQGDLAKKVGPDNPKLVEEVVERISTPAQLVH